MVIMEEEDEYFPRGGAKLEKKSIKRERRYLFETNKPEKIPKKKLGRKERLREKEKQLILDDEKNVEDELEEFEFVKDPFTYKNLREGTLSMCSITEVRRTHLCVALPERLTAKVPTNEISQPLSKLMKEDPSVFPLTDYFPLGFCLPCRVSNISKESENYVVTVATDPCVINSFIPFNFVCMGYTLVAAVQSCEDHGYLMATGITGLKSFLPHSKTDNYLKLFNSGKKLGVGQLVWCKVVKSTLSETSNVVELTIEPDEVSASTLKLVSCPDILMPGVQVNVAVVKVTPNVLYVKELTSDEKGFIPISHLGDVWSKMSDYKVGMEYTVSALFKFPLVDFVCYSMRIKPNILCVPEIKAGTLLNRAKIVSKDFRGIYVQLEYNDNIYKGVISMVRLKKTVGPEKFDELFTVGNHITVRVLNYHNLDAVYSCTTSNDLVQKGGHVTELKPGQLVDVKITHKNNNGILGTIGKAECPAFIPLCHILDTVDANPAKKISINQKYSGRILTIQETRNSAIVTLCPSLVSNTPLKSFDNIEEGEEYHGIVRKILPDGIVVTFFNDLTGLIHEAELPKRAKKFQVGEVVKCYIRKVQPNKKPLLSITKPLGNLQLKIGHQYPIAVKSITEKGLDCVVLENKKSLKCFLPVEHLGDCLKLCPLLLKKYEVGDKINNVILYSFDDQEPIFTLRYTVEKFFKDNPDIKERGMYAVKKNLCLPATISHLDGKEMLLYVPLAGYNGKVSTRIPKKLKNHLQINQGINVIVQNENLKGDQLKVIYQQPVVGTTYQNKQLRQFLCELSKLLTRTPGDEIAVEITSVKEKSVEVLLPDNSKGVIAKRGKKKVEVGETVTAMLLYEDLIKEVSYLCFKSEDLTGGDDFGMRIVHLNDEFNIGLTLSTNMVVFLNPISQRLLDIWKEKRGKSFLYSSPIILAKQIRKCGKFRQGFVQWEQCITDILNSNFKEKFMKKTLGNKQAKKQQKKLESNDKDGEEHTSDEEDTNNEGMSDEGTNDEDTNNEGMSDEGTNDEDMSDEAPNFEDTSDEEEIQVEKMNKKKVKEKPKENIVSVEHLKRKSKENEEETPKKKKRKDVKEDVAVTNSFKMETSLAENKDSSLSKKKDKQKKKSSHEENLGETSPTKKVNTFNEKKRSHDVTVSEDEGSTLNVETKLPKINDKLNKTKNDRNIKESNAAKALKQKKLKELENISLEGVGGFDWNATPKDLAKTVAMGKMEAVQEDSDEEVVVKKKLTPAERKATQIEAEKIIREKEEELLRCEENPQSADHFDRLLLGRPNDSKLWIKYMAFHLQGTDIDKARSIARRALKQINIREEQERLNVWIALLNMENIYGASECFEQTLSEALKYNDDYQVYIKVLGMYCESQKVTELDKLTNHLVRKFKDKTDCWLECQSALMRVSLTDKARNFLQRSLTSLPQKEHITLISRFALLENKHGFHEQAQSLFENLLTSYPQRTDLWNVYVDMLVKSGSIDLARGVLERIQSHKLPVRKMRAIYKKWLQFEEKYGNEKTVEHVRQAAESYVSDFLINKDKNDNKKKVDDDDDDVDTDNKESDEENDQKEEGDDEEEEESDDDSEED